MLIFHACRKRSGAEPETEAEAEPRSNVALAVTEEEDGNVITLDISAESSDEEILEAVEEAISKM